MIDGVVYLTGIRSVVYALDAASGALLWQFDPRVRLDMGFGNSIWSRWNRGAAVWEGRVYVGTGDCRLVAIDAAAGEPIWEAQVCDPMQGMGPGITGAPRVGGGRVYMGYAGSDTAARGSVAAFDAASGEELWRFLDGPGRSGERLRERGPRDGVAHLDRRLGAGRRRRRVGRDPLRPRDRTGHLRDGEHAAAERGHAGAGGQPVHQFRRRSRRCHRRLSVALPDRPGRRLGLRRDDAEDRHGHHLPGQSAPGGAGGPEERVPVRAGREHGPAALGGPHRDGDVGQRHRHRDRAPHREPAGAVLHGRVSARRYASGPTSGGATTGSP